MKGGEGMREIKYRAWDIQTESMRDVLVIDWVNELIDLSGGIIERRPHEVVLMQFTGLEDKKGMAVCECDVVIIENHPFEKKDDSDVGIKIEGMYAIHWNEEDLTWCAGNWLLSKVKSYVRVIGNIYENPELLATKKD